MAEFIQPGLIDAASRGAEAGESIGLAASRCDVCERVDFPARSSCSSCGAAVSTAVLSSTARLGAQTAVLHAPPGALVDVPYRVGVAEFPEGLAVLGLLVGDQPERGDRVEVVSVPVGDRLTYGYRSATTGRS